MIKLSIVSTLYCSERHLSEFYERVSASARALVGEDYEIILVNDGSPDRSLDIALDLYQYDEKLKIVDLSRNFGHHQAMMAGLKHASGDLIYLIDSDLEEEPEWMSLFCETLESKSIDVVYGVQKQRRDKGWSRFAGTLFYKLFRVMTNVNQPDHIVTARLMTKRYVEALLLHREVEINIGGLWVITGFAQEAIEVKKNSGSETTYSFSRKLNHVVNSITSFSSKPLVFTFYIGLMISFLSMLYVGWLVFSYFFLNKPVDGFTTIVASVWLLGGLIIAFMGVQGIYIAKVFSEVKDRPLSITRRLYEHEQSK